MDQYLGSGSSHKKSGPLGSLVQLPWQQHIRSKGRKLAPPNNRRPPPSSDLLLNRGSRQRSMPRSERVTVRDDTETEWERASRTTQMGRRESRKKARDKSKFNYNQWRGLHQRKREKTKTMDCSLQNEYNSELYPTGQIKKAVLPGAVKERLFPCVNWCLYLILIMSHSHTHTHVRMHTHAHSCDVCVKVLVCLFKSVHQWRYGPRGQAGWPFSGPSKGQPTDEVSVVHVASHMIFSPDKSKECSKTLT